ncbi:MAG: HIT family protein [Lachnospiraceae bacterium]|nr:HIT family protein [Lachnospiraceae bacterium]
MMDKNCIFCLLANGEIPTAKIYEDDDLAVILDAGPAAQGHALVIPKNHFKNITEVPCDLAGKLTSAAAKIGAAQMKALGADGFNIIINTNEAAGQSVFHVHVHVIPRFSGDNVLPLWKPGEAKDSENMAARIRTAME